MTQIETLRISAECDPLDDYRTAVSQLPHKLGRIAAHQRDSASNLSRAAAALRSMAALNSSSNGSDSRN